jgi:hypothetical protein
MARASRAEPNRASGPFLATWLGLSLVGCADPAELPQEVVKSAAPTSSAPPIQISPQLAPGSTNDPNPLELPARSLELAVGTRVFAPTATTLRGAKLGSTLALRATTIQGRSGDALILDGRDGPPYEVHAAYVIPITGAIRPRLQAPVIAEWAGSLRHGVVRRYVKDRIAVRFTDTVDRGERLVAPTQLVLQSDGFRAGNYAIARGADEWEHVLLISPVEQEPRRWLCTGYGGAARLVAESELRAVPVVYSPKVGALVWVEHLGRMRPGVVKEIDPPGWTTVRFERVGRPVQVGWGSIMAPLADTPPVSKPSP